MFLLRRVEGMSMSPLYPPGKIVFAVRKTAPRVGDVVIIRHHKLELIKRISRITSERVFLLGDNTDQSTDSRHYGWLPIASIMGVVIGGRRDQTDASA
jgi:nickel-type superoxide dismutase maturation protease